MAEDYYRREIEGWRRHARRHQEPAYSVRVIQEALNERFTTRSFTARLITNAARTNELMEPGQYADHSHSRYWVAAHSLKTLTTAIGIPGTQRTLERAIQQLVKDRARDEDEQELQEYYAQWAA